MPKVFALNPKNALKNLVSRGLVISMASAGVSAGVMDTDYFGSLSKAGSITRDVHSVFVKSSIAASFEAGIGGAKFSESFVFNAAVNTGDAALVRLSGATGDAFKAGKIEQVQRYTQHALSGFAVGAATNSVLGRDVLNGALSGAFGAVSGELIADWHLKGAEGKVMTVAELSSFKSHTVFFSGVTAALTSSALQLDPSIAAGVGSVVASENSLRLALGLAPHVIAALEAAGYTLAVYNGVQDAKENGAASGAVTGATEAGFMFVGGKIIPVVVNAASSAYKSGVNCLRSVGTSVGRSFGVKSAGVIGKGVKGVETPHGNAKSYVGDTHVYVIRDAKGKVYKVGESMQGLTDLGLSKRAESQIAKMARRGQADDLWSEIRMNFPTKLEARAYETELIQRFRSMYGADKLPGNKGVH